VFGIFEWASYPLRFDGQGLATIAGRDLTLQVPSSFVGVGIGISLAPNFLLSPKVGMGSRQSRPMNEDETESGPCSTNK
jgi:hypothetical protein